MAEKSNSTIGLTVVTPYKTFYESRVNSVTLPSLDGEIGFMKGHTLLVVALKPGIATCRINDVVSHFTVSEGFAEVSQHMVLVVCNAAEWPEDIVVREIADSYKYCCEERERLNTVDDKDAKKYLMKEVLQQLDRVKARVHLIEIYGNEHQRQKLVDFGLQNIK